MSYLLRESHLRIDLRSSPCAHGSLPGTSLWPSIVAVYSLVHVPGLVAQTVMRHVERAPRGAVRPYASRVAALGTPRARLSIMAVSPRSQRPPSAARRRSVPRASLRACSSLRPALRPLNIEEVVVGGCSMFRLTSASAAVNNGMRLISK